MLDDIPDGEDEIALRVSQEHKQKIGALLGYAKYNFLELDLKFGYWNPRPINQAEVAKMANSLGQGVVRYTYDKLIPIAVKREDINLESLVKEASDGSDTLPMIQWAKGSQPRTLYACGGQHRLKAMEIRQKKLQTKVEAADRTFKKASSGVEQGTTSKEEAAATKAHLDKVKQELKRVGMWGFAVYDFGEQDRCSYANTIFTDMRI